MKLIKAFVRVDKIDDVLGGLELAGAPGATVSRVHGVGYGYRRHLGGLAPNDLSKTEDAFKVEVVCRAEQVADLLDAVVTRARTGFAGDGIVFVTHVEQVLKIRDGKEGREAL
ncbi:nitrogen regulatory protein P-II homolog [Exaiptasia diaphana]|uniref:Nitrogen regulatory protein P-II n=1 Tax=Exaiptasia diaphana TaxID=2652724 RepID=A0A913XH29_EXADI|nr:nitrogen regulatory protein P-II homolog [Exaiptasia diaphana]